MSSTPNDDSLSVGVAIARRPQADKAMESRGWKFFTASDLIQLRLGHQYEVLCLDLHTYHVILRSYDPLRQYGVLHFLHWSSHFDYEGSLHCVYLTDRGRYSQGIQAKGNIYPSTTRDVVETPKRQLKRPVSAFSDKEEEDEEVEIEEKVVKKRRKSVDMPTALLPPDYLEAYDNVDSNDEDMKEMKTASTRYEEEWLYKPHRNKRSPRLSNKSVETGHKTVLGSTSIASMKKTPIESTPHRNHSKPSAQEVQKEMKEEELEDHFRITRRTRTPRKILTTADSTSTTATAAKTTSTPKRDVVATKNTSKLTIDVTDLEPPTKFPLPSNGSSSNSNNNNNNKTKKGKRSSEETPSQKNPVPFDAYPEQLQVRINEEVRKQNLWRELIQILFGKEFPQQSLLNVFESIEIRDDILEHLDSLMRIKFDSQLSQAIAKSYPNELSSHHKTSSLLPSAAVVTPLRLLMPRDTTPQYIENIKHTWARDPNLTTTPSSSSSSSKNPQPCPHVVTPSSSTSEEELKPQHDIIRFIQYMMNIPFQMHLTARLLQDMKDLHSKKDEMASCDHPMIDRAESLLQNLLHSYAAIYHE